MGRGQVCHFFVCFPLKEAAVLRQMEGTETMIESLLFFLAPKQPQRAEPRATSTVGGGEMVKGEKERQGQILCTISTPCLMDPYHIAFYRLKEV